jgi:hypothetical protein
MKLGGFAEVVLPLKRGLSQPVKERVVVVALAAISFTKSRRFMWFIFLLRFFVLANMSYVRMFLARAAGIGNKINDLNLPLSLKG